LVDLEVFSVTISRKWKSSSLLIEVRSLSKELLEIV